MLVESKNSTIVSKHLGYLYLSKKWAPLIIVLSYWSECLIIIAFRDSHSRGVRDEEAFKEYYTTPAKKRAKFTAKAKAMQQLNEQTQLRGESIAW